MKRIFAYFTGMKFRVIGEDHALLTAGRVIASPGGFPFANQRQFAAMEIFLCGNFERAGHGFAEFIPAIRTIK
ncbi:MAG: hypothetical protein ALAOOOJD_00079 [bacterium]|nr:hypothetical protein [bacterium]